MACVNKDRFPAASRAKTKQRFRDMVEKWKKSTNTKSLEIGCKHAMVGAMKQYASIGCEL